MSILALRQFTAPGSGGASKAADFVAEQMRRSWRHLQGSYTLGQEAKGSINELFETFQDCQDPNWDGHGAAPVIERTFRLAYTFLEALPLGTPAPSVGAEPDGHITLEWYSSPRWTLSVSISPEADLHYAALRGASKEYGTRPFYGEVPDNIIDLIHGVTSACRLRT